LGSSKTLDAGVDTRLEEGEVGRLEEAEVGRLEGAEMGRLEEAEVGIPDRGDLGEEAGSPTSGRYGLWWVFMDVMQTQTGIDEGVYVPAEHAGLLYSGRKHNIRN
jgi:hypothetical protein